MREAVTGNVKACGESCMQLTLGPRIKLPGLLHAERSDMSKSDEDFPLSFPMFDPIGLFNSACSIRQGRVLASFSNGDVAVGWNVAESLGST